VQHKVIKPWRGCCDPTEAETSPRRAFLLRALGFFRGDSAFWLYRIAVNIGAMMASRCAVR
jgi:hypothetical protein